MTAPADSAVLAEIAEIRERTGEGPDVLLAAVKRGLEQVIDPCSAAHGRPLNLWEMGLVRDLRVQDGVVSLHLYLTSPACTMLGKFHEMTERALLSIEGVDRVEIIPDTGLDWPGMPGRGPRFTGLAGQRRGIAGLQ